MSLYSSAYHAQTAFSWPDKLLRGARVFAIWIIVIAAFFYDLIAFPSANPHAAFGLHGITCMMLYCAFLIKPGLLPVTLVVLMGAITDLYHGVPLFITPMIFMLIWLFVRSQRGYFITQNFIITFIGCAAMIFVANILYWLMICLTSWHLFAVAPLLIETIKGIFIFPLVYTLMFTITRLVP